MTPTWDQRVALAVRGYARLVTGSPLQPIVEGVERASALDPSAKVAGDLARKLLAPAPLKQAVSGTWLGHVLHPLLTDVVIGAFVSATLLDVVGGRRSAAASERLILAGMAAYGPTALTGVSDWADSEAVDDAVRRTGIVHAVCNSTALALYAASLVSRRRGARRTGIALGFGGAGALMAAGYLGGHLSYAKGLGVDQTVFDRGPTEWTDAITASELVDGASQRVVVDETPVLLLRDGDELFALHDRCSHRGCSLSEGELDGDEIVCACHGSRFDRRDGSVVRGPATAPQPTFATREREGSVQVRRRGD